MRTLTLLMLLVAGVAGAQQGTTNCRSSATACSAASFSTTSDLKFVTGLSSSSNPIDPSYNCINWGPSTGGNQWWMCGKPNTTLLVGNNSSSYTTWRLSDGFMVNANGTESLTFKSTQASGSNAFAIVTTGAWFDLGAGSNDRIKSDGTNVVVDTGVLSSGTYGTTVNSNPKVLLDTSTGAQLMYGTNELFCDSAKCAANVIFRPNPAVATTQDAVTTPVGLLDTTDRDRNGHLPQYGDGIRLKQLGGARHWGLEGRWLAINSFHNEGTVLCPRCTECNSTTLTAFDGQTCAGVAAATNSTVDGLDFHNFNTQAVANDVASWTTRVNETRRNQYPHMTLVVYVGATTSERVWYGISSGALSGSDTPTGDYAAFRFSTNASDTTWKACTRDNTTTSCTDTTVTVTANQLYVLEIDCRDSAAGKCLFTVQNRYSNAAVTISKTTNLPTAATGLKVVHYCETLTTAAKTCGIAYGSLETY